MNRSHLIDSSFFQKTANLLAKSDIPFWLDSGTLLGYYRDGCNLSDHNHINISINGDHLSRVLELKDKLPFFYRIGTRQDLSRRQWIEDDIARFTIRSKNRFQRHPEKIQITIKYKHDNEYRWVDERSCKHVPARFYDDLEKIEISGKSYFVPSDTAGYLEKRYENWEQKEEKWVSRIHDLSIAPDSLIKDIPKKQIHKNIKQTKEKVRLDGKYKTKIETLLLKTIDILDKNKIPYWVDEGTLLGLIRDGDFIPWDYDADLGVSGEHVDQVLSLWPQFLPENLIRKRVMKNGWINSEIRSVKIQPIKEKLLNIDLHLDIFFKYKTDNMYRWFNVDAFKQVDAKHFDNLNTIEWKGNRVKIPSHAEEYLTQNYGNWEIPDENFDPSCDRLLIAEKGF